jgi:serine phosphatase RsbU (regulator of sigma subunit)
VVYTSYLRALSPSEVFRQINTRMVNDVRVKGLFLTAGCVLFDLHTGELQAASPGHTPMLLRRETLGLIANADFRQQYIEIHANDRLMLYTDGQQMGSE